MLCVVAASLGPELFYANVYPRLLYCMVAVEWSSVNILACWFAEHIDQLRYEDGGSV